jgi:transglutaminase-like putative cysteine protease
MMTSAQVAGLAGAELLDHQALDLDAASRVTYVLQQAFRYDYDEPVRSLRQRLVIVPRARHGSQYRRAHALDVSGAQARRRVRRDSRGNVVAALHAEHVTASVEFRLTAILERVRGDGPVTVPRAALTSPGLLRPTRLTAADGPLRELSARLADPAGTDPAGTGSLEAAERICDGVHAALSYRDGVTTVDTTAAQALAGGAGVCQDFAHVMLAVCHLARLPARYVSGHLLGQGGTHAWVEVVVPDGTAARAVAFDPCNGRRAGSGYLTVATGRDYADVAPTSGSYVGGAASRLTAQRRVGVLSAA